jgi:hypothetical protein
MQHLFARSKGDIKVYWAGNTAADIITTPEIEELLNSARTVLLQSDIGLRHLALMTYGDNVRPTEEELVSRMMDITTYLHTRFPIIVLQVIHDSYGITPDPTELPRYRYFQPWLSMPIELRRTLQLQFSLNICICELFKRSSDNR